MRKYLQFFSVATLATSVAWAGIATANDSVDKELEGMDLVSMSYVEARMSKNCYLQTRQDGDQYVVNQDECKKTLNSLEEELAGVDAFAHELEQVQEFRETFNI